MGNGLEYNKLSEKSWILLIIREMQIRTQYHFTPIKVAITQKITRVGENVQKLEPSALLVGMENGGAAVEHAVVPQKIKHGLTMGSSKPLLGVHPEHMKAGTRTDMCTPVFAAPYPQI